MSTDMALPAPRPDTGRGDAVLVPHGSAWPRRIASIASHGGHTTGPGEAFRHSGLEICVFADGATALLGIGVEPPSAVLVPTDPVGMALPEVVGVVVRRTAIPVLVGVTDTAESRSRAVEALELGAKRLVPLPTDAVALSGALVRLGMRTVAMNLELTHGPIVLNPQSLRVTVHGRPVHLTPKEFDVLRYLMLKAPRVVAPDELVAQGLGSPVSPENGARIAVLRIRRKLAAHATRPDADPLIETVRGVGYRLAD